MDIKKLGEEMLGEVNGGLLAEKLSAIPQENLAKLALIKNAAEARPLLASAADGLSDEELEKLLSLLSRKYNVI